MKLLKTALSAAIVLCLLLSVLPAASALEADERFDGKSWLEVVEEFNERLSIRPQNVTYGYRNTVTGEEHFYNGDTYMVSGSMYKVPLNMVVAEELYNGEIDWDTQFGGYNYKIEETNPAAAWRFDPQKAGPSFALGDVGTHPLFILEAVAV